jgi:hypothetical protein
MSISNIYPTGTNTEVIDATAYLQALSLGPGLSGATIAGTIASVELGKTFNIASIKFPLLTASITGTNKVECTVKFESRFNAHPTLADDAIIGTAYVYNFTDGTYVLIPIIKQPLGGGEPAGTFKFDTPLFNIVNTKQYDITYILTYPHA